MTGVFYTRKREKIFKRGIRLSSEFQAWFGVTEDGQRGWKEQGADTVHPFRSAPSLSFLQASGASGGTYDVKATSFTYTADEAMTVLALCISGGYNFTPAGSRTISSTGEEILRESRTTTNTAFLYAAYSLDEGDTITLFAQGNDWVHASSCILWKVE